MNLTKVYRRPTSTGDDVLTVMASVGTEDDIMSEIRLIHTVDGSVVTDELPYFGPEGEQWLQDQDAAWTADGYELISSGPDAPEGYGEYVN